MHTEVYMGAIVFRLEKRDLNTPEVFEFPEHDTVPDSRIFAFLVPAQNRQKMLIGNHYMFGKAYPMVAYRASKMRKGKISIMNRVLLHDDQQGALLCIRSFRRLFSLG